MNFRVIVNPNVERSQDRPISGFFIATRLSTSLHSTTESNLSYTAYEHLLPTSGLDKFSLVESSAPHSHMTSST